ncbi:hypothetical protein MLD38_000962 [Melastoma candidum]|nr:hypothetical protein MLD38_000962 [Melastoma candidum]
MEARALWMQELYKQTKMESDWLSRSIYHMKIDSDALGEDFPSSPSYTLSGGLPFKSFDFETVKSSMSRCSDSERCLSLSSEMQITSESAVEENSAVDTKDSDPPPVSLLKIQIQKSEDEEDDVWPEDEDSDLVGYNLGIIPVGSEEDISFSDLEDDEDLTVSIKSKPLLEEQQGKHS